MTLPDWLGSQEVCFLDLTFAKPILDWGKIFIRATLWINLAMFMLKKFDIDLSIG